MSVIADLIRAGVDPELVAKVADELEAASARPKSAGAIRQQRYRERNKERNALRNEKGSSSFPLGPPPQTPPPIIPQAPPLKKTRLAPLEILRSVLSERTAKDVIAHRKAKRAPLTSRAAELLAAAFRDHGNPEAAAEAMIANGWQGFRPEWVNGHQPRAGPAGRSNGTMGFLEAVARDIENDRRRREESTSETILSLPEFRN